MTFRFKYRKGYATTNDVTTNTDATTKAEE